MEVDPSNVFQVLVTGSRKYRNRGLVNLALDFAYAEAMSQGKTMILIHGACPSGADKFADDWATDMETLGFFDCDQQIVERPADWDQYGKSAGYRRNAEMVNLGPDVCLAFIRNKSRGASHTAGLAEKAGILTRRYEEHECPDLGSTTAKSCTTAA